MKLSANFSITFFSPPFFLPEIHRLSDQIEHILRVFILLTCNNSSFVSRTDDSIERVKKKERKWKNRGGCDTRPVPFRPIYFLHGCHGLHLEMQSYVSSFRSFLFFFFFIGGNWHGARRPINCARETR